ncbi:OmpA family protein [Flavobacterium zepuense]|uniref:OmpA family protein n=1 Tax=Flavobacterium zepuense TaxID=2593302 RepID=A0A552UZA1_9FLAO|nr:OmpA family protein [Flavobacterium zepuense]TRW23538.1 OmpA family protein [Flavobacterium zepuense]
MTKRLFLWGLVLCATVTFAQSKLKKADNLFANLAYIDAAKAYEDYFTTVDNPKPQSLINAAESNYYTGNTGKAVMYYEKYIESGVIVEGANIDLHYSQALRMEKKYDQADLVLFSMYKHDENRVQELTKQKTYLDSINGKPEKFELKNLASNTAMADFGTVFYNKQVVFTSAKDSVRNGAKVYDWNGQPYLSIFIADRNADGTFSNEKKFLNNAQTGYHNAAVGFSPNLKTVYVSVNNVDKQDKLQNSKKGTNNIQLVYGEIQGDRLTKKQTAPFNSADYSVGQPAVSSDGKWLYFVSDMPGGYGATDIYYCKLYPDGALGTPKNAGPQINTQGREMFPYYDGGTLYFSSDGHYGMGGLDVFKSTLADDSYTLPQNLGKPVNSNRDDFAYIINNEGWGYVSSNREGGRGDDDIYYFTPKDVTCEQVITGKVTNKKSGEPIQGVQIKANVAGSAVSTASDKEGVYSITIPCDAKPDVTAALEGYTTNKPDANGNVELQAYKDLVKLEDNVEKVDINPIYFDFDQYYITPQAATELDKVVFVMQHFPDVVIKIESHTDSRGKDDYNLRLSDDRAKSTYSYIVSKGIDPKRIESVKGYGETQLRNKCSNDVPCTDEEHQLNRRSDFIIVKK